MMRRSLSGYSSSSCSSTLRNSTSHALRYELDKLSSGRVQSKETIKKQLFSRSSVPHTLGS